MPVGRHLRGRFHHDPGPPANCVEPSHEYLLRFWRERQAADQRIEEEKRIAEQREREICSFLSANKSWKGTFAGEAFGFLPTFYPGARLRFENPHGRIRMLLELEEDCRIENLKDYWHIVSEWQRRLLHWQGPSTEERRGRLYATLADAQLKGYSYKDLADILNNRFVAYLMAYLKYESEPAVLRGDGLLAMAEGAEPRGNALAAGLVQNMGLSSEDTKQWCDATLENLRAGKPPFLPDGGPVTRDMVISRVKAWRKRSMAKTD